MGSQVSCLEEQNGSVEEIDSVPFARSSSPSQSHKLMSWSQHSFGASKIARQSSKDFPPKMSRTGSKEGSLLMPRVESNSSMARQMSPSNGLPAMFPTTSIRSRQLSLQAPHRETSNWSDPGSSGWATALDKPSDFSRATVELAMDFPMWLMPAEVLVNLKGPLQPHHELVESGKLVKWHEGHSRKVVLISHQWAGKRHPDPKMEQIKVLQDLLRDMAAGKVQVTKDLIAEASGSDLELPSKEEQCKCLEWDIWYDFFGIPQVDDRGCVASIPELQAAVDSIPAYCDAADYVIILAPTVTHADTGALMNYASWGSRGWCRAERTATVLSAKEKPLLVVTGPSSIFASSGAEWIQQWPHDGDFTVEEDRATVKTLTKQLLELKCAYMLQIGDVSRWRFYKALYSKILQARSPWSRPGQGPQATHQHITDLRLKEQILDSFKVSYQFASIFFLDSGLTPLMLACIEGSTETVQLLIDSKADVDATWDAHLREAHLEGRHSALSLAAALSSPQVAASLLDAGADIDAAKDNQGNSLIGIAALFGNHEVIPVLVEKGVKAEKANLQGDCPLMCAMLTQNPEVVRSLLDLKANPNVKGSFGHTPLSMCAMQGLVKHAAYLLEAGAEVNGTLAPTASQQVRRRQSKAFGSLARGSRAGSHGSSNASTKATVEDILSGTPLHLAAFNGNWPMTELLLRYNADPLEVGKISVTALELAQEYGHSDFLLKLTGRASTVDYFVT